MDSGRTRERARDPQDLEPLLVARQHAGDVNGMVALYEPDAVVDIGGGVIAVGTDEIAALFAGYGADGRVFDTGEQRPAIVSGDVAMTSTRFPNGIVTAEIARRQPDGTWLWVIDRFDAT